MKKTILNVLVTSFCIFCLISSLISTGSNNGGNTGASTYSYFETDREN